MTIREELTARAKLMRYAKSLLPPGAKFSVDGVPLEYVVEVTCDGAVFDMGYRCCLAVGHEGKCWSKTKQLNFTRIN
jgi:hypothetical protein